ncbi:hypothetical protein [Adhaeribacter soli]|uniref:Uncharacterized protein n=1 Tax=Adhaeribacter soli TaxID=2607655 RepID=A0A5N1IYZ7_9BACT|nr:hypothetical protein [Adhaeribacter soli]KAA9333719.1 hypothetical protein F0P94_10750 [Adhaeribacter soli]
MRLVANIPHEDVRISVFAWNDKFLVKFEKAGMEQTYKIAEIDIPGDGDLEKMLDEEFIDTVLENFQRMGKSWKEAQERMDTL